MATKQLLHIEGEGPNTDWKFSIVSWTSSPIFTARPRYYWHVVSRNGRVFLTGGEDLTRTNRDKAVAKFLENWRGPLRVLYYNGPTSPVHKKSEYIRSGY